jgi:anti-sigma B factor antagonist
MTSDGLAARPESDGGARPGVTVVTIEETSIDGKTAPLVREKVEAALTTAHQVILDMSAVSYLSSAGLRLILLIYREMTAKQGAVVLVGISEDIETTMKYTGFRTFFELADTIDEAVRMLS